MSPSCPPPPWSPWSPCGIHTRISSSPHSRCTFLLTSGLRLVDAKMLFKGFGAKKKSKSKFSNFLHPLLHFFGKQSLINFSVLALHSNGVTSGSWTITNVVPVSPPVPVRLDHGAHLTIEEAVGESDEEALE